MSYLDDLLASSLTLKKDGVALPKRAIVNFTGDGVELADNESTAATDADIPGVTGGAGGISVLALATSNVASKSGTTSFDDVSCGAGSLVLLVGQTDASENGVWTVKAGAWTRAPAMNTSAELRPGLLVFVRSGTIHAGRTFQLVSPGPLTIDDSPLEFRSTLDHAAAVQIGGTAAEIAFLDVDGVPAVVVLPDSDGGTTIAATDDVTALSIGLLTNDSPGTDSRLGLRLAGGDGRPANPGDPNNDGRTVFLLPGKAGTGGTGTAKPGPVVITDHTVTHPPATVGMIRAGNPGDWNANGVLLAARNDANSGNVALLSLDSDDNVTVGDASAGADIAIVAGGEVSISGSFKREDYLAGAAATVAASSGQPTRGTFNRTLQTTDATPTVILTLTLPADCVGMVRWEAVLKSGSDTGAILEWRRFECIVATAAVGAALAPLNDKEGAVATATCVLTAVGGTLVWTATGVAATVINWALFVDLPTFKP